MSITKCEHYIYKYALVDSSQIEYYSLSYLKTPPLDIHGSKILVMNQNIIKYKKIILFPLIKSSVFLLIYLLFTFFFF